MANEEHRKILEQGVEVWNKWRKDNPDVTLDLKDVDLTGVNLPSVNLRSTDLSGANLSYANLKDALLSSVDLRVADLSSANLSNADLSSADLSGANLSSANLRGADLFGADLFGADLSEADLSEAEFTHSTCKRTVFANNDLSVAKGLDGLFHFGPSEISISTLYRSAGKIPERFLRGCGVPDDFITYIPSLFTAQQAIQFYSCFISYSTRDGEFVRRLYSRMRDEKLRVWFAPEDIKGGEKLHEQLERAIQLHDRLLLVLSEHSIQSEWVTTEIRKARKAEAKEKKRKLFPIRLIDFDTIREWECFDADTGKDLAVELREYFIPDFSNWKDHDAFEVSFERLLHDLKAEETSRGRA